MFRGDSYHHHNNNNLNYSGDSVRRSSRYGRGSGSVSRYGTDTSGYYNKHTRGGYNHCYYNGVRQKRNDVAPKWSRFSRSKNKREVVRCKNVGFDSFDPSGRYLNVYTGETVSVDKLAE